MPDPQSTGSKLGPRLTSLVSKGVAQTIAQATPHKIRAGMLWQDQFFGLIGGELKSTFGPMWAELADHPDAPAYLARTMDFLARGHGQAQAIVGTLIGAGSMIPGLGAVLSNEMAPFIQGRLAHTPNAVLSPEVEANLVARGMTSMQAGSDEANKSAVSFSRFKRLVAAAYQYPDLSSVLELMRRGLINHENALTIVSRSGYPPVYGDLLLKLSRQLLSVADLAQMEVRGIVSSAQGAAEAKLAGVSNEDFQRMVKLSGNPPGVMDLLAAYRRGIIGKARLEHGIRQSDVRDEWTDVIEALRHEPLGPAGAVEAAVQSHLSESDALKLWEQGGMRPADFKVAFETAGAPPGVQQMLDLLNRGLMTEAQVRQGIRESRLKTKYVDVILASRRRVPPQDTVSRMIKAGVISSHAGVTKLMDLGFSKADATALAQLAGEEKTGVERDLSKAEILELYELHGITSSRATEMISALGFDSHETAWLVSLADLRRKRTEQNAVLSVIRSKFVGHKTSEAQTSAALDSLQVPADQRDHLMHLWSLERQTAIATLTPAQVLAALKKGAIELDDARRRLQNHGYADPDVEILLGPFIG